MAYMSQERKQWLSIGIKAVLKKYGVKGTISVDNGSGLVVKIKSGPIDFIKPYYEAVKAEWAWKHPTWKLQESEYIDVNVYHIASQWEHNPKAKDFLLELHAAMSLGNHDESDAQIDYFNVGWYTYIKIGEWNKPYKLEENG